MNDYTVYCHTFPNNKKYVGITKQKPKKRWNNGNGYSTSPLMKNAIKKYKWHNVEHKILYIGFSKKEAENMEIKLIKEWKTNNIKYGYNINNGGSLAGVHSKLTKNKLSKVAKGRKLSEETKNKIRLSNSGIKNYLYRKPISIKRKKLLLLANLKPINQYDKCGNFIRHYKSIKEASTIYKINNSNISQCCMNKRKTAGGYKWEYSKEMMTYQ